MVSIKTRGGVRALPFSGALDLDFAPSVEQGGGNSSTLLFEALDSAGDQVSAWGAFFLF